MEGSFTMRQGWGVSGKTAQQQRVRDAQKVSYQSQRVGKKVQK